MMKLRYPSPRQFTRPTLTLTLTLTLTPILTLILTLTLSLTSGEFTRRAGDHPEGEPPRPYDFKVKGQRGSSVYVDPHGIELDEKQAEATFEGRFA